MNLPSSKRFSAILCCACAVSDHGFLAFTGETQRQQASLVVPT